MKNYVVSKNKPFAIEKILQYFNETLCVIEKKLLLLARQYYNAQSKINKKYCISWTPSNAVNMYIDIFFH